MDTVPIIGDQRMSMEAIMSRDQRTTSHRVIERGAQSNCTALSSCQNNSINSGKRKNPGNESPASMINEEEETRATVTCRTKACDNSACSMDTARELQTENIVESLRRDTHRCRYNCQSKIPSVETLFTEIDNERCDSALAPRGRSSTSHHQHGSNSTTWLRLISLLLGLFVISVQGAPTTMSLEDRRLSSPPKWVNPCGLAAEDFDSDLDVVQLRDEQLLRQVVTQAKTALSHAQLFRDNYMKRTLKTDLEDLRSWKIHYDWLPGPDEIPKQLGDDLNQEYLDKLKISSLDEALLNAYEYMQRYAVGLEQIVWDQEDYNLEFLKQFKETEFNLRTVLCELQVALIERGVTLRPDITRDIMAPKFRSISGSETHRNFRDGLIFRDYMNGLEYIVQVFDHLRRSLES